jgi:hypothetical protein
MTRLQLLWDGDEYSYYKGTTFFEIRKTLTKNLLFLKIHPLHTAGNVGKDFVGNGV